MTPADELSALYQQWRRLTESESQAIRSHAWAQVEVVQSAKARLQPRIAEVSAALEPVAHQQRFYSVVEELIQLEQGNRELIQAQRQIAQQQKEQLDQTSRNLRQLHRSYAPTIARAHWQSYS